MLSGNGSTPGYLALTYGGQQALKVHSEVDPEKPWNAEVVPGGNNLFRHRLVRNLFAIHASSAGGSSWSWLNPSRHRRRVRKPSLAMMDTACMEALNQSSWVTRSSGA